jgi:hypothetical protein
VGFIHNLILVSEHSHLYVSPRYTIPPTPIHIHLHIHIHIHIHPPIHIPRYTIPPTPIHPYTQTQTPPKGMCLVDPKQPAEQGVTFLREMRAKGWVGVRFNPYLWPQVS